MTNDTAGEKRRLREVLKEDARETKVELGDRLKAILSRPINLLFIAIGAVLVFAIDYTAERIMDRFLDVDAPQVVQLDSDLQAASEELRSSANDIKSLVASIDIQATSDAELRRQFGLVQAELDELSALVEKASSQTDKVAAISEALRDDWLRNKERTGKQVDRVPDIMLAAGEAVQVCQGLSSIGAVEITTGDGTARLKVKDWTYWVRPGQRVPLTGGAFIDFIGLKQSNAQLKVNCPD